MKSPALSRRVGRWAVVWMLLAAGAPARLVAADGAVTNWVAFNDHNRGSGTAPRVSTYTITGATGTGGPLTNLDTGALIAPNRVGVAIRAVGTINSYNGGSDAPRTNTPADQVFGGKIGWTLSALGFGGDPYTGSITITFTNLTPDKRYNFRGTAVRGNNFRGRWTLATLAGAAPGARAAHETGTGTPASPGIVTNGWPPYGDALLPGTQAAWNSGENRCGDVIGWNQIEPISNSFSVVCENYHKVSDTSPSGPLDSVGNTFCYAFNAFMLAEVEPSACVEPVVIFTHPTNLTVSEYSPFSLVVGASGCVSNYQWFKDNIPIAGANAQTYVVPRATLDDAGDYHALVQGPVNSAWSLTNRVAILLETNPPCVVRAVARPDPFAAGWDQVVVTFSEPIHPEDALNLDCFSVFVSGNPSEVLGIVNAAPLDASNVVLSTIRRAPETDYTLTVSNLRDSSGNQNVIRPPCDTIGIEAEVSLLQLDAYPLETASVWRYSAKPNNDLGTAWRRADYDDSAWPAGPAPLDAKNDSPPGRSYLPNGMTVGAPLPRVGSPDYLTRYFRTRFHLAAQPEEATLVARYLVDDGCVVYLNGQEAFRLGMAAGSVGYSSTANRAVEDPGPNVEGPFELASTNLVPGLNVVAVELHQNTTTSSDATLGLELLAYVRHFAPPRLRGSYEEVGRQLTLAWTAGPAWKLYEAPSLAGPWTKLADASPHSVSIPTSRDMKFFRLQRP